MTNLSAISLTSRQMPYVIREAYTQENMTQIVQFNVFIYKIIVSTRITILSKDSSNV